MVINILVDNKNVVLGFGNCIMKCFVIICVINKWCYIVCFVIDLIVFIRGEYIIFSYNFFFDIEFMLFCIIGRSVGIIFNRVMF